VARRDLVPAADGERASGALTQPAPDPLVPAAPAAPAAREAAAADASLWYLVAAGALYAGMLLGLVSLTDGAILERAETDPWTFLWLQCLDDGLLAGVALLFARVRYPGSWSGLGFRLPRVRWWALGAGGGLGAAALAWGASVAVAQWTPVPTHPVESLLDRTTGTPDLLLVLLAVTVPVAVGEETFFRGYAYRVLRTRFGRVAAIGGTALLFALVHGLEPGAWLPILPVGVVLALLVEWSGSLWPAVTAHGVINALAVLLG
jgi:membrane protease YdiL (CAAX protease family)